MGKPKITLEKVCDLFQSKGLTLENLDEYINTYSKLTATNTEGYRVVISYNNLSQLHYPQIFATSNPNTLWNIKNIWLPNNAQEYVLYDDVYVSASTHKMTWGLKNSDLPTFKKTFNAFRICPTHPQLSRDILSNIYRKPTGEVLNEIEEALSSNHFSKGWKLVVGDELNYKNNKTLLNFISEEGYLTQMSLIHIRRSDTPFKLFYSERSELSYHNLNLWLSLNSKYTLKSGQCYEGYTHKYTLICDKHGEFDVDIDHLIGQKAGCKMCYLENNFGENHPNWNPNLADEERLFRRDLQENITWRVSIFARDEYICQYCQQKGGAIIAHHLDGYHWCVEKRFDQDNGITLCKNCHKKFHSIYGYGNNTRKQFVEWKEGLNVQSA